MPDDSLPPPTTAPLELPSTDPGVVRIVAAGLVALAILILGGLLAVAAFAHAIPASARIAALGTCGAGATTAIGAAAALLASTRSRSTS